MKVFVTGLFWIVLTSFIMRCKGFRVFSSMRYNKSGAYHVHRKTAFDSSHFRISNDSFSAMSIEANNVRKPHKNKYADKSVAVPFLDPRLLVARAVANKQPAAGVTVPLMTPHSARSSHVKKSISKPKRDNCAEPADKVSSQANTTTELGALSTTASSTSVTKTTSVADIDPSDPFSFGYTKIGYLTHPKGLQGALKVRVTESDFISVRLQPGSTLYLKHPHRRTPRPVLVASSNCKYINNNNLDGEQRTVGGVRARSKGSLEDCNDAVSTMTTDLDLVTTNTEFVVHFVGIESVTQAARLKGYSVFVKTNSRPVLGLVTGKEFLAYELVGLTCVLLKDLAQYTSSERAESCSVFGVVDGIVSPASLCSTHAAKLKMHSLLEIRLNPNYGDILMLAKRFHSSITRKQWKEETCKDLDYLLVPAVRPIIHEVDLKRKLLILSLPIGMSELTYNKENEQNQKNFVPRGLLAAIAPSTIS